MPHRLQRILILAAAVLLLPAAGRAEIVDRVVAVVNNDVITLHDLNEEGADLFRRIRQEIPPAEQEEALRRARQELLSNLIDKRLLEQRAAELKITVSDEEVNTAMERILARNGVDRKKFLHDLQMGGTTEAAYRSRLRTQILQQKVIGLEVRSRIVVTDQKVKEYYDSHFGGEKQQDGYHVLQMGVAWKEDGGSPTREEARAKAEKIRSQAAAGGDFQELAKAYSDLPSAADGGDIGVFGKEEMAPYMREVVEKMKPGEVSPVVETPAGFQFFKLLSIKQGDVIRQAALESMKDEIRDKVYKEESEAQFDKWLKDLRDKAYVKKLL
ncbi:MAG: peptidylprolyl isomerase [Desulfobacteraceae bacterium]|nr:peptidylprolyl isomerase [Desulfobacteraceae bacterium]